MFKRLLPLCALLSSGCLLSDEDEGVSFEVGFYGVLSPVHAYDDAGARGALLGFGAVSANKAYSLADHASGNPDVTDTAVTAANGNYFYAVEPNPWWFHDSTEDSPLDDADSRGNLLTLELARDSTHVFRTKSTGSFPFVTLEVRARYAGAPCTYSNLKGTVWDSTHGALPVKVTQASFHASADSLRFSVLIDTAASKAAEPRLRFTPQTEFYGTMRVSCP